MKIIVMSGWQEGMQKISLTKLQIALLGLSLKDSKENVDRLLEGTAVTLEVSSADVARNFVQEATNIGVCCQLVASPYKEA